MAQQDAYIKEVDLLHYLADGIRNCTHGIESRCDSLRSEAYLKQEKLQHLLLRIRRAVESAADKLAYAKEEFENYRYYTDEEDYCTSEAYALREAIEEAKYELDECKEDYDRVLSLCQQIALRLEQLDSYTQSFQPSLESAAATLCHTIRQAAHDITQYKSIK